MIEPCPLCKGRLTNSPKARISNPPCDYCAGHGMVDTDRVCKCGRPAVLVTNGQMHCTLFACGRAILESDAKA
jgi:ferredoxin-thioredoxin reductase catalytic subunit